MNFMIGLGLSREMRYQMGTLRKEHNPVNWVNKEGVP